MKVKRILGILSMSIVLIAGATSCSSDDDNGLNIAEPTIKNIEVGHDNSGIGYAGSDLHLEADIEAEGLIENVQVTIHPAEHDSDGWEFSQIWTEGFEGAKNAVFHQHIDIPADAAPGEYHVHFSVTDQEGNVAKEEAHLEIKEDPNAPSWEKIEVEYEGEGILHVEGNLSVPDVLNTITIEVHQNDGGYQEEFEYDPSDFDQSNAENGNIVYHVYQHIHIDGAPAGDYHIHIEFEGDNVPEDEVFGGTFTVY